DAPSGAALTAHGLSLEDQPLSQSCVFLFLGMAALTLSQMATFSGSLSASASMRAVQVASKLSMRSRADSASVVGSLNQSAISCTSSDCLARAMPSLSVRQSLGLNLP